MDERVKTGVCCGLLGAILGFFLGLGLGTMNGRYMEQIEAAKAGAGRWEVDRGAGGVSFVYYRVCR